VKTTRNEFGTKEVVSAGPGCRVDASDPALKSLTPQGLFLAPNAFEFLTGWNLLEPAFLSGLLNFVLGFLLFLDRSHVLGALFIAGLLLAALVANDTLALVVWHGCLL
jgi:hypothetical protein